MRTCAIIPAAGSGSRLGLGPKFYVQVTPNTRMIDYVLRAVVNRCDDVQMIVSPGIIDGEEGRYLWRFDVHGRPIKACIQDEPLGMGHAIFQADFDEYDRVIIIWSDQVFVTDETVREALLMHRGKPFTITVPLVRKNEPYVDYFCYPGRPLKIAQSRDGDTVRKVNGLSDVGVFVVSTQELRDNWLQYMRSLGPNYPGELNFLPFISFLVNDRQWNFETVMVDDPLQALGINTPDDLFFAKHLFEELEQL